MENEESLKDKKGYKISIIVIIALLLVFGFILGNAKGTISLNVERIFEVIMNDDGSSDRMVIWNIRLPRMILAALVGCNLALSGAILQGVMKNPLADPSIIGISSGAGLFAIVILVIFPQYQHLVPLVAFCGAMLAAIIIYILAWKGGIQPTRVILAGVAVSALFGAGISGTLVLFSDRVHGALTFMNGSLSSRSWPEVQTILPYTIIGMILVVIFANKLNILVLGDDVARGLGLNVEVTRIGFTALAALMAASAVSVVGLLGFVGLIVPHSVRLLLGNDYKYMFPASALLGATLVIFSDTFARTVFSPVEIPVGIVMAVLGAPFFLYLLRR
ncbi:iron chelate uptake ABC transporter family permease subunit [Alkalibaculum sp. M08DMB]|uniref:Iron chelate uptake ABC transporter family permease subunit n=1 Tax=Alkalibaculum sporogenes TaxID=2655001 RepID=A0A6A7K6E7_9FIRM|nr:iron ABC transporter permease [Alkalibaculum sporogenes]MPW24945.1 iron chelate uptake ABC transporter family permease subunit [Alkalibaculum sporogenes]